MNEKKKRLCFFITPIGEAGTSTRKRADFILNGVITPAIEDSFKIERADKISSMGLISHDVIKHCLEADLIIADLSDSNPNVYYELAIADMQGTPVITILQEGEALPFDIKDKRTLYYDLGDWDKLEELKRQIQIKATDSSKEGYKVSNPITAARSLVRLDKSSDSSEKLLSDLTDEVRYLRAEVERSEYRTNLAMRANQPHSAKAVSQLMERHKKSASPMPDWLEALINLSEENK